MRSLFVVVLALLCVISLAEFPDFVPCSFDLHLTTEVKNKDGDILMTSIDRIMRDSNIDLWRWDSDFSGNEVFGVNASKWIIIWRPDMETSYHDYGSECVLNDGRDKMVPPPFDWLLENVEGGDILWFWHSDTYEGVKCHKYEAKFVVKDPYGGDFGGLGPIELQLFFYIVKDTGAIVKVEGSLKTVRVSDIHDITINMNVDFFESNIELRPAYFIPSPHCTGGQPISAPPKTSEEFANTCYGAESSSAGSRAIASLAAVLLLLILALLF